MKLKINYAQFQQTPMLKSIIKFTLEEEASISFLNYRVENPQKRILPCTLSSQPRVRHKIGVKWDLPILKKPFLHSRLFTL